MITLTGYERVERISVMKATKLQKQKLNNLVILTVTGKPVEFEQIFKRLS